MTRFLYFVSPSGQPVRKVRASRVLCCRDGIANDSVRNGGHLRQLGWWPDDGTDYGECPPDDAPNQWVMPAGASALVFDCSSCVPELEDLDDDRPAQTLSGRQRWVQIISCATGRVIVQFPAGRVWLETTGEGARCQTNNGDICAIAWWPLDADCVNGDFANAPNRLWFGKAADMAVNLSLTLGSDH